MNMKSAKYLPTKICKGRIDVQSTQKRFNRSLGLDHSASIAASQLRIRPGVVLQEKLFLEAILPLQHFSIRVLILPSLFHPFPTLNQILQLEFVSVRLKVLGNKKHLHE